MKSVDELLQSERGRTGFTAEARAGLWKGIELSVGPLAGTAPDPTPPETPPQVDAPTAPGTGAGAAAHGAGSILSAKLGALLAVVALGAGALGAAAHARWAEPRTVIVERVIEPAPVAAPLLAPIPATPTAAPPAPIASVTAPVATATSRAAPPSSAPSAAPPARDPALARERTLLDIARTALSRGDSTSALATLDTHARDFPRSQLGEEREVLAIQALASANRLPEARRRAAAFRASYPKSALLPIVEESTQ